MGTSSDTIGAQGISTYSYGLYGVSRAGSGVVGTSSSNIGVAGTSSSSIGVAGTSTSQAGILGTSTYGSGVEGTATGLFASGVYGYASGGAGVTAESAGSPALYAQGDASGTYLLRAYNAATASSCSIDGSANLICTGSITGGSASLSRHRNGSGQHVNAYGVESASETIEDTGSARLLTGIANVQIPTDFASLIDPRSDYYVFVTPLGDTRGLFVSIKTYSAFQVRENEHGRSSVAFDYRIVAHPIDASNDRLPLSPRMKRPPLSRRPNDTLHN